MRYLLQDNKDVIKEIIKFAEKRSNSKELISYIKFILEVYSEYPKTFKNLRIYSDYKWSSQEQIATNYDSFKCPFIFLYVTDEDEDTFKLKEIDVEKKELDAFDCIFIRNYQLDALFKKHSSIYLEHSNNQKEFFKVLCTFVNQHRC